MASISAFTQQVKAQAEANNHYSFLPDPDFSVLSEV